MRELNLENIAVLPEFPCILYQGKLINDPLYIAVNNIGKIIKGKIDPVICYPAL